MSPTTKKQESVEIFTIGSARATLLMEVKPVRQREQVIRSNPTIRNDWGAVKMGTNDV